MFSALRRMHFVTLKRVSLEVKHSSARTKAMTT
uniref:Uncharacterized protein MANES_14G027100 n=1 Tax=Rhizophora mucronata TaxID=61149 RepID=A0A2P2K5R1_RHIMU